MTETGGGTGPQKWTSLQAYILAAICLLIGIAVGYLLHGSSGANSASAPAPGAGQQAAAPANGSPHQPTPQQMKAMADKKAEPILEQLKSKPNDPALLADAGNIYFDAHLFPIAIDYYQKSLSADPKNGNVRTDMATAMAYTGNIDQGIAEFDKVLKEDPKNGNALFNRGIVKWQGKMDIKGALADWDTLLKVDPNYPQAQRVRMFIEQARKHMNLKPGEKPKESGM
jgi:cytochrome c-type biogenesis protein CcmH/NrfG